MQGPAEAVYRWDWKDLRAELPGLARRLAAPGSRGGPESAPGSLSTRPRTSRAGGTRRAWARLPQHAGLHRDGGELRDHRVLRLRHRHRAGPGADFDVYMPDRWARDLPRRARRRDSRWTWRSPPSPRLAMNQLERLAASGLHDPVGLRLTRCTAAARNCASPAREAGLAYVAIIPCRLPGRNRGRHRDPRRSGRPGRDLRAPLLRAPGTKGPPESATGAMTATRIPGQSLLIRRLVSRPDQYTFYLCWAPEGRARPP